MNTVDVLFCNCSQCEVIPEDRKKRILSELTAANVNLIVVPDLCGMAAERDPFLADLAKRQALKIVACFPRSVRWLFHRAGAPLPENGIEFFNMRAESAEAVLSALALSPSSGDSETVTSPVGPAGVQCDRMCENCASAGGKSDWISWFPVIDYSRCTKCGQCLEFCLFGVYESDGNGGVSVANPAACKTNCPACARICPHAAIIFPKVEDDPINGAEIKDEEKVRVNAKINVEEYLGENVYAALAVRKMKRKALLLKKREDGVPV